ncbi:MAG: tetratricopeptide repeat protein [Actinobacteria bacterium]|nr:tetratricopeptide repeat protein [Actinomycetota bacterium]
MSDEIRRSALEQRIRIAQQDLADLQAQVDDGELDEAAASELEARYRRDLEEARSALAALPKPVAKAKPKGPGKGAAAKAPAKSPWPTVAVVIAAMVLATVVIVVLATSGDGGPTATTTAAPAASGSLAEMEAAVAAQPDNNAMRLALADMYFESGDFMSAMNHYSTVTASDPTDAEAAVANARIGWMAWAALNDAETALSFLDTAIALDPVYGEAVLWKAIVLLYGMEDGEAAVPLFEEVLGYPDLPDELRPEVERMLDEARGGGA